MRSLGMCPQAVFGELYSLSLFCFLAMKWAMRFPLGPYHHHKNAHLRAVDLISHGLDTSKFLGKIDLCFFQGHCILTNAVGNVRSQVSTCQDKRNVHWVFNSWIRDRKWITWTKGQDGWAENTLSLQKQTNKNKTEVWAVKPQPIVHFSQLPIAVWV